MHIRMVYPNFDWNQARAFLATAECGSLSAAARQLGQTQPTLGRQVTALEETLGVVLFERVGRGLELTQSGVELLDHVRAMRDAADRVSLTASGQSQTIDGQVRITASDAIATYILPRAVEKIQNVAPRLEIDIVATNDVRDLQRREADIAIRHVRPDQPNLIARLLSDVDAYFYAASRYLDRVGRPTTEAEMRQLDFISMGDADRMLLYFKDLGLHPERAQFRINSDNGVVGWECCRQGLGIAPIWDEIASQFPEVEKVLPDQFKITFPIWLTTHRELHTSRRIRLVFDILAEVFRSPR